MLALLACCTILTSAVQICACAPALRAFVARVLWPRITPLMKLWLKDYDLTTFIRDKDRESTIESPSRLQSREEIQLAVLYPYQTVQTSDKTTATSEAPAVNTTGPLAPLPTDAQIVRANLRRANIIHFHPPNKSESLRSQSNSAYSVMPAVDEHAIALDFAPTTLTRKKSLTPKVLQDTGKVSSGSNPIVRQHVTRHHNTVISLERQDVLHSPTIIHGPSHSVTNSSISTLPIIAQSPDTTPMRSPPQRGLQSATLRIPERTLRSARRSLFGDEEMLEDQMNSLPVARTSLRETVPVAMSFFDQTAVDRAASPVTRYVRQQHSLLHNAIALDRARLGRERRALLGA